MTCLLAYRLDPPEPAECPYHRGHEEGACEACDDEAHERVLADAAEAALDAALRVLRPSADIQPPIAAE